MAKDGIQLIAKARVTVRANIKQLVGGAGEETVLARVGEGIVSSIGSAVSHKVVLENPDSISRVVLDKGLDAGTAFEILSIDIADIDVGKNIGAQLQMDQAQADKNIAQAKAEERRAMAVALEQENRAKAQDARAKVILAEAEVPLAMAEAFRNGNLGIMDYYKMKKTSWPIRPCAKRSRSPSIKNRRPVCRGDCDMSVEELTYALETYIRESPRNYVDEAMALVPSDVGQRLYDTPLVRVGSADDPEWEEMKRPEAVIGHLFRTPKEWLPEAVSVVSYFAPFSDFVVEGNQNAMRSMSATAGSMRAWRGRLFLRR